MSGSLGIHRLARTLLFGLVPRVSTRVLACVVAFACSSLASGLAVAQDGLPVYPVARNSSGLSPQAPQATETRRPRFDDRPFAVALRTGAGTATGLIGLVLEYNLHDRVAVNAGLGTNLLGISSAIGVRVRPLLVSSSNRKQLHAFVVEASLSRSAYQGDWVGEVFFCDDRCVQPRYVGWAQAELGWEARIGHWQLQTTLGAAMLVGNPRFSCLHDGLVSPANCDPAYAVGHVLFTQTLGAGYAF